MDKRIILFAAGALVMGACSSNDPEAPASTGEIRLYTEVAAPTRAAEMPIDLQDTQFAAGTDISVLVTDKGNLSTTLVSYDPEIYRADGIGGLAPVNKQYYPASGNYVDIWAYHPWDAQTTEKFSVKADQTSTANYRASDLMWARLADVTKDTPEADRVLKFDHLFTKVIVRLVKGSGVTDAEMNTARITLGDNDLVMGGTFDVPSGSFERDNTDRGTLLIAKDAGTSLHAAVVVPQEMDGKKLSVGFVADNAVYATQSYAIPAETIYQAGKKYTYTITVNKAELVVTATIEDWTTPDGWVDPTPNINI